MKKIIPFLLFALLLSASIIPPVSSWYNANDLSDTSLVLFNDGSWHTFNETSFDVRMNNYFMLQNGVFAAPVPNLYKLSGDCRQGKQSHIALRIVPDAGAGYPQPLLIVTTYEPAFSFAVVYLATSIQLQGYNYDNGVYDELKCNLLFEKVQ
jgi:hypothetical protein